MDFITHEIFLTMTYFQGGLCWPAVFLSGKFVSVSSKDLLNFEPPIENAGYTSVY